MTASLEVTTIIGCPGNCVKYCAQEVFLKRYGSRAKVLTVENWSKIIKHIPVNIPIWFGAFSEPLLNPDFIQLAKIAYDHGNEIAMYTTLLGSTDKQIDELVKLDWKTIVIHLPDGIHLKKSSDVSYSNRLCKVLTEVANVQTMKMNKDFKTIHREEILRNNPISDRKVVCCSRDVFHIYQPTMLPDGIVQPCCVDMALNYPMGSLLTEDWETITARITKAKKFDLCRYCVTWGLTRKQKNIRDLKLNIKKMFEVL
jgi:hypothetical protein